MSSTNIPEAIKTVVISIEKTNFYQYAKTKNKLRGSAPFRNKSYFLTLSPKTDELMSFTKRRMQDFIYTIYFLYVYGFPENSIQDILNGCDPIYTTQHAHKIISLNDFFLLIGSVLGDEVATLVQSEIVAIYNNVHRAITLPIITNLDLYHLYHFIHEPPGFAEKVCHNSCDYHCPNQNTVKVLDFNQ